MDLVRRINAFFQKRRSTGEIGTSTENTIISEDYRQDGNNIKPFAVSYFRTPEELPQDWYSSTETGTTVNNTTQKDD